MSQNGFQVDVRLFKKRSEQTKSQYIIQNVVNEYASKTIANSGIKGNPKTEFKTQAENQKQEVQVNARQ